MHVRLRSTLLAGAAATLMMTTGIPPAGAATTTWTVTPGGVFYTTASGGPSFVIDHTTGIKFKCGGITGSGIFKKGSGLTNPIGKVKSIDTGSDYLCGDGTYGFQVTVSDNTLGIYALRYEAAQGQARGQLRNLDLNLATAAPNSSCTANIDGTAAAANDGWVPFGYAEGGGDHDFYTQGVGGDLRAYNVSGCDGLISDGDSMGYQFEFYISSKHGLDSITSP
jgi:hypothetical protein